MMMDADAIERLTAQALRFVASRRSEPHALLFLLRRFEATGRPELLDCIADAIDVTLDADPLPKLDDSAAWLPTLAAAARTFDDARIRLRATELASSLRHVWRSDRAASVSEQMSAIDACLCACELIEQRDLVATAIDEMERIVGLTYRPGAGVAHTAREPGGVRGGLADQVHAASALLTAFEISSRLPYSMLAEELVQTIRRTLWHEPLGGFVERPNPEPPPVDLSRAHDAVLQKPFALNCDAAIVLCRLAALHDVPEYRGAAVTANDADYRRDAQLTLAALPVESSADDALASRYGLALDGWLRLP